MASGLLDKANIILTPTGYKAGTMYNVAPIESPYEDFDFARASVASRVNSSGLVEMVGRTLGSNLVQNGDFSEIGTDLVQNGTFNLGPELVTNGDFSNGTTGWSSGNSTLSVVDGKLKVLATSAFSYARQDITAVSGKTYKITANFFYNSLVGNIEAYDGTTNTISEQLSEDGVITLYVTPSSTNLRLTLLNRNGSSGDFNYWDNVSVKEVPDWTLGTGWSVENNKAYFDNSTGTEITQSLSTTANTYKINFDLDLQSGSCRVYFNSPGISTQITLTSSGNKTAYVTTTTNHTKFTIAGTGGSEFNITNVVVQELDPNDYWTLGTGWSLGDDALVGNGTMTASDTANQAYDFTDGNTYKFSFEITERTQGSVFIREPFNGYLDATGDVGVHTFYYVAGAANELRLRSSDSFIGKITNVIVQEVIDTNNIPRINYDSNGENGHWLLEPTSTNLITYSEDFSQLAWTKDDTIIEGGYTAPDGSNTAYKITNNGSNAHLVGYNGINTGNHKSIWAKTVSGTGDVYLLNRSENNLFSLTNEWQRFDAAHLGLDYFYAVDFRGASTTLSEVIIWGCQLEALPYATSYIPTLTGSTETRATETANGAGSADLINSTEGVLYAEIAALANDGTYRFISLNGGGYSNSIRIGYFTTSNTVEYRVVDSNAKQVEITHVISDTTDTIKLAAKYKANDFALWINGVEVATDTSGTVPSNLYELDFNDGNASNNSPFYGKCKELAVFGEALSDDELEKLTSWSSFNAMATDLGYTIE